MYLTETLRNEHDQLLVLADWLGAANTDALPENLTPIFVLLARFNRLLWAHLSKEDRILYPAVLGSTDMDTASMGRRFQEEVGSLHEQARKFEEEWNIEAAREQ